jgi:hypothetical protein
MQKECAFGVIIFERFYNECALNFLIFCNLRGLLALECILELEFGTSSIEV